MWEDVMDRWEDIIRRTAQSILAARLPVGEAPPAADEPPVPGPRIDGDVGLVVRHDIDEAVWRHRRPSES
jgi:hypothetical protein